MAKRLIDTKSEDKIALENDLNGKANKQNITAGTGCKITYNSEGIITYGTTLQSTDIPSISATKITSGTVASARLPTATSSVKGAVMPVAKTAAMTQSVGVDSSGRLYTTPSGGGGGGGVEIVESKGGTWSTPSISIAIQDGKINLIHGTYDDQEAMGIYATITGITRNTFTSGTELVLNNDYKTYLDYTVLNFSIPNGLVVHYPKGEAQGWRNARTDGTAQEITITISSGRPCYSCVFKFLGTSTGDCEILMIPTVVNKFI